MTRLKSHKENLNGSVEDIPTFINGVMWLFLITFISVMGLSAYGSFSGEEFPRDSVKKTEDRSEMKLEDIVDSLPGGVQRFIAEHPVLADYVYIKNKGDVLLD